MINEETIEEHVSRYFKAVHGSSYVYKAPEGFPNALDRWMLYIVAGAKEMAEKEIKGIEKFMKELKEQGRI